MTGDVAIELGQRQTYWDTRTLHWYFPLLPNWVLFRQRKAYRKHHHARLKIALHRCKRANKIEYMPMLTREKFQTNVLRMRMNLTRSLPILVLSLLLSLPGLVFADHLHDTATEEVNCELCGHIGAAAPTESMHGAIAPVPPQRVTEPLLFALSKTPLFRKQPRGPPLTC